MDPENRLIFFYELILQQFEKTSLSSLLEASVSAKGANMFLLVMYDS